MLGLLFKVSNGCAPKPIMQLFRPYSGSLLEYGFGVSCTWHSKAIHDPVETGHPAIIKRSVFGIIRVFNTLPQKFVDAKNVRIFQRLLQAQAKGAARAGKENWQLMFHAG